MGTQNERKITIKELAKQARVSIATVSYALNGRGKVSKDVRDKILALAKINGYQANIHARNLRKQDSQEELQVFLPNLQGLFYSEIISGIEDYIANQTDYLLNSSCLLRRNYSLRNSTSKGFIIFYTAIEDSEIEDCLSRPSRRAITLINRKIAPKFDDLYTSVCFDNYTGSTMACRYLYEKYGADICLIAGPSESFDSLTRIKGYMDFMGSVQAAPQIHSAHFMIASAYEKAQSLIQDGKLSRAYFCTNDEMAYGFLQAFQHHGLSIPGEVALMGFDDVFFSRHSQPPLTTIRQPIADIGKEAARLLLAELRGEEIAERHITCQPELMIRESA